MIEANIGIFHCSIPDGLVWKGIVLLRIKWALTAIFCAADLQLVAVCFNYLCGRLINSRNYLIKLKADSLGVLSSLFLWYHQQFSSPLRCFALVIRCWVFDDLQSFCVLRALLFVIRALLGDAFVIIELVCGNCFIKLQCKCKWCSHIKSGTRKLSTTPKVLNVIWLFSSHFHNNYKH